MEVEEVAAESRFGLRDDEEVDLDGEGGRRGLEDDLLRFDAGDLDLLILFGTELEEGGSRGMGELGGFFFETA